MCNAKRKESGKENRGSDLCAVSDLALSALEFREDRMRTTLTPGVRMLEHGRCGDRRRESEKEGTHARGQDEARATDII